MLQKTMLQKTMLQKTMLQKNTFRICVGVAFFCFHSMAVGGIFDFAVDFDAATNPSASGWQYNHDGAGTAGVMGGYSTGDFGGSQMGWVNPGANHLGWAQIDNAGGYGAPADAFDIQNGDVITHAATSFSWTATAANAGNYAVDLESGDALELGGTPALPAPARQPGRCAYLRTGPHRGRDLPAVRLDGTHSCPPSRGRVRHQQQ